MNLRAFEVPERYSPEWWAWIASATTFFTVVSFGGLYYFGIFDGLYTLIGTAVAISILGDIVVAYAFEAIAPSKISLAPGERHRHDEEVSASGIVESGFSASDEGRVMVRGELWRARHFEERVITLAQGEEIRIVGRDGLTLLISEEA
ncbi:MAG: NfeD family protein [Gammaproteobacteria bacterium]